MTNVYMKKAQDVSWFGILNRAQQKVSLGRRVSLLEAIVEIEVLDGSSRAQLGVAVSKSGSRGNEKENDPAMSTSWNKVLERLEFYAWRLRLYLDQARLEDN